MRYVIQVIAHWLPQYLPHVLDEGVLVVLPFLLESGSQRILVTSKFQRNLEVIRREVVEILHPCNGRTVTVQ